ncbi:complement C1q tumor necrosis factor-related protein 7 isoform X2 [Hemibagrus wyckioides]|uniref:complement C1q tumor necrosis factor-related protein 7 isoform X2 n=1 Tax=Hemibagrus wyckioides TaxID=337641 RepID=UPI00266B55B9|nr:complement C1q tumor necrosis factor-related protein 7 isoform X2 [Hemibagrus wyckioides]
MSHLNYSECSWEHNISEHSPACVRTAGWQKCELDNTRTRLGLIYQVMCKCFCLKMRVIVGIMCLCQCVVSQLLLAKGKTTSPRFICSVPGLPGTPGKPGPPGSSGPEGHIGIPGRDGRDGRKGEKGEKGETGIKGKVGPTGKIGERGERGPTGKRGPEGDRGDTGNSGPHGRPGLRGEKGHRGPRGVPGKCLCGSLVPKSAFSVAITSSYPAEQAPIKFNKVLFDEGGHYNPQTGKFICAYPGIYYFSYDITLANKHLAIGLVQNGKYRIKTYDANTGNHDVTSASTVIFLNPEDEVWLEIFYKDQNGLFYDPSWADSLFSGFLLYADTNYLDTLSEDYS